MKGIRMGLNVSAVIITKNEEAVIGRCIESLHRLDEVVVCDTGSEDNTIEVARSAGARVFCITPEKPFHFANARNSALKGAKHDWVLTIDADEVLEAGAGKKLWEGLETKYVDAFLGTHINHPPNNEKVAMPTRRKLLFRKSVWEWKFRVHERLFPKGNATPTVTPLQGLIIRHLPLLGKGREIRRAQNLELLKLCVEESPDHRLALFQLGLEHMFQEEWKNAIQPLQRYVEGPCEGYLGQAAARMQLARALARSGDLQHAMNEFVQARKEAPGLREPLYWAALELIRAGYLPDAIWWLEEALRTPKGAHAAFSLYSAQLRGTLIEDTLAECRQMIKKAEASRTS